MKIEDAMTAPVETVHPEASLKDVAAIFAARGIGGLPVVDAERRMIGVITEADIILKEQAEVPRRGLRSFFRKREADALRRKVEARTVGEAMTTPVVTVEHWLSVSAAAELMIEHGVNRLPVLQGGKLVGIITRHDLVRAFARSDSEIEQEIRKDALVGVAMPENLRVVVKDGEVLVRGEVDSKYDAEAIPGQIRRIPGVVAIDAELSAYDPETHKQVLVQTRE